MPGEWTLAECVNCSCIFHEELHEPAEIAGWYYDYAGGKPVQRKTADFGRLLKRVSRRVKREHLAVDLIPEAAGESLLEIGAGSGHHLLSIADRFVAVSACDYDQAAMAALASQGIDSRVLSAGSQMPFRSNEFDLILSMQVIEHVQDQRAFCADIYRMLKPNGCWLFATPNGGSTARAWFGANWVSGWYAPFHLVVHNPRSVGLLMEQANFEVIDISFQTPASWLVRDLWAAAFPGARRIERLFATRWYPAIILLAIPFCWIMDALGRGACMNVLVRKKSPPRNE